MGISRIIEVMLSWFFGALAWIAHFRLGTPMSCKIWVKEKTIELWVDGLDGLPASYNDSEIIRKHPLLLRIRLWLALSRIRRRNRKLTKFYLRNIAG